MLNNIPYNGKANYFLHQPIQTGLLLAFVKQIGRYNHALTLLHYEQPNTLVHNNTWGITHSFETLSPMALKIHAHDDEALVTYTADDSHQSGVYVIYFDSRTGFSEPDLLNKNYQNFSQANADAVFFNQQWLIGWTSDGEAMPVFDGRVSRFCWYQPPSSPSCETFALGPDVQTHTQLSLMTPSNSTELLIARTVGGAYRQRILEQWSLTNNTTWRQDAWQMATHETASLSQSVLATDNTHIAHAYVTSDLGQPTLTLTLTDRNNHTASMAIDTLCDERQFFQLTATQDHTSGFLLTYCTQAQNVSRLIAPPITWPAQTLRATATKALPSGLWSMATHSVALFANQTISIQPSTLSFPTAPQPTNYTEDTPCPIALQIILPPFPLDHLNITLNLTLTPENVTLQNTFLSNLSFAGRTLSTLTVPATNATQTLASFVLHPAANDYATLHFSFQIDSFTSLSPDPSDSVSQTIMLEGIPVNDAPIARGPASLHFLMPVIQSNTFNQTTAPLTLSTPENYAYDIEGEPLHWVGISPADQLANLGLNFNNNGSMIEGRVKATHRPTTFNFFAILSDSKNKTLAIPLELELNHPPVMQFNSISLIQRSLFTPSITSFVLPTAQDDDNDKTTWVTLDSLCSVTEQTLSCEHPLGAATLTLPMLACDSHRLCTQYDFQSPIAILFETYLLLQAVITTLSAIRLGCKFRHWRPYIQKALLACWSKHIQPPCAQLASQCCTKRDLNQTKERRSASIELGPTLFSTKEHKQPDREEKGEYLPKP